MIRRLPYPVRFAYAKFALKCPTKISWWLLQPLMTTYEPERKNDG